MNEGEEGRWTSFVAPPPLLNWIKVRIPGFFNSFVVAINDPGARLPISSLPSRDFCYI